MKNEQPSEAAEKQASVALTEALMLALARVPVPPLGSPDPRPPIPADVVIAVATFVSSLRAAGVPPEAMLVTFKRLLKSAAPAGGWHSPAVERALITAAITTYFNGSESWSSPADQASKAPRVSRGGKSVLVVDDNEDSRFILGVMLQGEGIDALLASNGAEALLIARHADLGLILMDLAMPGVDGKQVLLLLRQLSDIRDTPVVAITSFPTLAQAPDLLSRGFAEVVMKPIGPADLRRVIRKHSPALVPARS